MSSIYGGSFSSNIRRIFSSFNEVKRNRKGKREDFKGILRDLDKKPLDSSGLEEKIDIKGNLTNLNPLEKSSLNIKENREVRESINPNSFFKGVKEEIKPVKKIALKSYITPIDLEIKNLKTITSLETEDKKTNLIDKNSIINIIKKTSQKKGVDPALSLAIARAESNLDINAISKDGHKSKGLFQLLDSTAREMILREGEKRENFNYNPFNPKQNTSLAVGYLRYLLDSFSESRYLGNGLRTFKAKTSLDLEKLAISAFNAGEGNVAKAQQKALSLGLDAGKFTSIEAYLPTITRGYVNRVGNIKSALLKENTFID